MTTPTDPQTTPEQVAAALWPWAGYLNGSRPFEVAADTAEDRPQGRRTPSDG